MSRKPSATDVPKSAWSVVYDSDLVEVQVATVRIGQYSLPDGSAGYRIVPEGSHGSFLAEFWKVKPVDGKAKTFFGESAWSDARRYASDFDFGAWSIN